MTTAEIKDCIRDIADTHAGDDESQHSLEDSLHKEFIQHVAEVGPPELAAMAKLVLTTSDMQFARWCA